jgi:large subunit ribosomal protein L3
MINTLLGKKEKMAALYVKGTRVPVTWVNLGPCIVTQVKSVDKDGYYSVQLGFSEKKIKNISKSLQGHLKGAIKEGKAPRFLREVRFESEPDLKVGDIVKLSDVFKKGDLVSVTGVSKGKGFAGVVKRHHFAGGPKTHGQSDRHRAPGSIGQGTTPGRVLKGKRMAGRMGGDTVSIKNLIIVDTNTEKNLVAVSGPIAGPTGSLVRIKKIASGSLEELVEKAPEVEEQVEEAEKKDDKKE